LTLNSLFQLFGWDVGPIDKLWMSVQLHRTFPFNNAS
jgi:hypothetical protein